tara:strand:- start:75 stop:518 length:444 start_codon:yes stop_codon:yes gene_type:complete
MPSRSLTTILIVIFSTLLIGSILFQYMAKPSKMHHRYHNDVNIKQITLPKPHYPSKSYHKGLTISSVPTDLNLIHKNIDERLEKHHHSRNISQPHHDKKPTRPWLKETVSKENARMMPSYKMHSSHYSIPHIHHHSHHHSRPKKKIV